MKRFVLLALIFAPALVAAKAKAKAKRRQQAKAFSATLIPDQRSQVGGCLALGVLFELPGAANNAPGGMSGRRSGGAAHSKELVI